MAAIPKFKRFAREDFAGAPSWFEPLLVLLNEILGAIVDAFSKKLTRSENLASYEKDVEFTTEADSSAPATLAVKNELPFRPRHCWATFLERADGSALSAAYSFTWTLDQNNQLRLKVQGLSATTKYRMRIVYE